MTRIQLACYALIASAMTLGGLLVVTASQHFEPTADAQMVINKDVFTVLTAEGISSEQFIYMLDNKNERLLCYTHKPTGRIELFGTVDVRQEMQRVQTQSGGGQQGGSNSGYSR